MATSLAQFNAMPGDLAAELVLSCCAAPAWAGTVAGGRPYADRAAVLEAAERAMALLPWDQILQALAAHPRIGEKASGESQESAWSRREQASMGEANEGTKAQLAQANRDYEARFGHIFLIFASGRSPVEMMDELQRRLANDEQAEQEEVRGALTRIALLRLERLLV